MVSLRQSRDVMGCDAIDDDSANAEYCTVICIFSIIQKPKLNKNSILNLRRH